MTRDLRRNLRSADIPRPGLIGWFWLLWTVATLVLVVVVAVESDMLGALLFVPYPMVSFAQLVYPWLELGGRVPGWALVVLMFVAMATGLLWFGIGMVTGPILALYGVVVRNGLRVGLRRWRGRHPDPVE